ncbi:MAG: Rieske (2Fe-2S) protein [Proteobacteria bacterium]|nr:Rieske (2Fe-2S) protein [Pseudomonadota bacterium]
MGNDMPASGPAPRTCASASRRRLLCAALAAGLARPVLGEAADADPSKQPPQPGDVLAFASWDDDPRAVSAADVALDAAPLSVYPQDPASGVTRENSRLNQILLLRLAPDSLDEATRARAVDGIVAYSAICTHAACAVSEWAADKRHLVCPCHSSEYDPAKGAARVTGPTARPLPSLPIKQVGDKLVIAGPFSGALGAPAP